MNRYIKFVVLGCLFTTLRCASDEYAQAQAQNILNINQEIENMIQYIRAHDNHTEETLKNLVKLLQPTNSDFFYLTIKKLLILKPLKSFQDYFFNFSDSIQKEYIRTRFFFGMCKENNLYMIKYLIANHKFLEPNLADIKKQNLAHILCSRCKSSTIAYVLHALSEKNILLNWHAEQEEGLLPIQMAIIIGRYSLYSFLIESKIYSVADIANLNLWKASCKYNRYKTAKFLINKYLHIFKDGSIFDGLLIASKHGSMHVLMYLLPIFDAETVPCIFTDEELDSAIKIASEHNKTQAKNWIEQYKNCQFFNDILLGKYSEEIL